jgi:CRP-like cAMP-binding protein
VKTHKYWAVGALACMVATFYTGVRGKMKEHKIFAIGAIGCMLFSVLSGYKMISVNGEVELGSINVNGKVLRITNISEGEDFGEVELFLNKDRYSGYAKAKTDVKLLEIAKDFFGGRCEKTALITAK